MACNLLLLVGCVLLLNVDRINDATNRFFKIEEETEEA